jgi:hypothetical protein
MFAAEVLRLVTYLRGSLVVGFPSTVIDAHLYQLLLLIRNDDRSSGSSMGESQGEEVFNCLISYISLLGVQVGERRAIFLYSTIAIW